MLHTIIKSNCQEKINELNSNFTWHLPFIGDTLRGFYVFCAFYTCIRTDAPFHCWWLLYMLSAYLSFSYFDDAFALKHTYHLSHMCGKYFSCDLFSFDSIFILSLVLPRLHAPQSDFHSNPVDSSLFFLLSCFNKILNCRRM